MNYNDSEYKHKYLKYKNKYINLKNTYDEHIGGDPACNTLQKNTPTMKKEKDALFINLPVSSKGGKIDTFKVKLVDSVQNLLRNKTMIVHGNVNITAESGAKASITVDMSNPVTFSNVLRQGSSTPESLTLQSSALNKLFTFTTSDNGNNWGCSY
jgi:hypothetical protein